MHGDYRPMCFISSLKGKRKGNKIGQYSRETDSTPSPATEFPGGVKEIF